MLVWPSVSRWIGYSLAALLVAGFALLAWFSLRLTSIEGVQVPHVLVDVTVQRLIDELQTPASTAARLSSELKRARVVPRREALLQRIDAHAAQIDRLGVQRKDLQILDLLTPTAADARLLDPQREALVQVLALIRSPGYMDVHTDRRVSAAGALSLFDSEAGLLALVGVLENPTEPRYLKQAVAEALEQLQDFRAVRAVERYRSVQPAAEFEQVGLEVPLASSSRSVRRRAIETLGATQDARATGLLLQALDDPDAELRALALKKLRGREDERIRPAVITLISRERARSPLYFAIAALRGHEDTEVVDALLQAHRRLPGKRSLLLGALAECDDPRVVGVLIEALRDPDGELRFAARQGLGSLAVRQPDLVIEPLIYALTSEAPLEVKRTAAEVLSRSTGQNFGLDVAAWADWYRFLADAERAAGSRAWRLGLALLALVTLGGLVLAAGAYRERQRLSALSTEELIAEALAELDRERGDARRAVDRVLLAARRASPQGEASSRDRTMELLDRIDHPYLIEALVELLEDPDPRMRQLAAQTLGQLRDASASDALVLRLGDEEQAVFESALEALRRIHLRGANLLINAYGADAEIVRQHHALALVDIIDPRLADALLEALASEHPQVRLRAFHVAALQSVPDEARGVVERALDDPDPKVRQLAVMIAGKTGSARSLAYLLIALRSEQSPSVRRELVASIQRAAPTASSDLLVAALQSDVPAVREAGARALARFDGDAGAVEGLVQLLIAGLSQEVEFVTLSHAGTRRRTAQFGPDLRAALESLRKLGGSFAVALLTETLAGGTTLERRGAALALEALAHPAAVEPLAAALTAADPVLRLRAASALGVLGDAHAIGPLVDAFAVSQSHEVELRETLHWALVRLTGSNYGPQPATWISWWARNKRLL